MKDFKEILNKKDNKGIRIQAGTELIGKNNNKIKITNVFVKNLEKKNPTIFVIFNYESEDGKKGSMTISLEDFKGKII